MSTTCSRWGFNSSAGRRHSALTDAPGLQNNLAALTSWQVWAGALGVGLLCCALPYHLYTTGLRDAEPGRAAILATLEPFVAAGLGIVLFREEVTPFKLLGMAAILGAVLLLNVPSKGTQS